MLISNNKETTQSRYIDAALLPRFDTASWKGIFRQFVARHKAARLLRQ